LLSYLRLLDRFFVVFFDPGVDGIGVGMSSSLVNHHAEIMTSATITKMTRAVFLSKPEETTGVGLAIGEVLKFTVKVAGGFRELLSLLTSSATSL